MTSVLGRLAQRLVPQVVRRAFVDALEDRILMMSAALAYYTSLSFAPSLLLLLWIFGVLGPEAQQQVVAQVDEVIGPHAGTVAQAVARNASDPELKDLAGIVTVVTLLVSASGVFAQLQEALNLVWQVRARPGQGLLGWLRKRLMTLALLGVIAFLFLASLGASAVIGWAQESVSGMIEGSEILLHVLSFVISILLFTVLFATIFNVLPDVVIAWRDVWLGGLITAVLFSIGKTAIGLYLGHASIGSAYGAAGSLVVMLAWAYFASMLVLFGAELTQAQAYVRGHAIRPNEHAVTLPRASRKGEAPPR